MIIFDYFDDDARNMCMGGSVMIIINDDRYFEGWFICLLWMNFDETIFVFIWMIFDEWMLMKWFLSLLFWYWRFQNCLLFTFWICANFFLSSNICADRVYGLFFYQSEFSFFVFSVCSSFIEASFGWILKCFLCWKIAAVIYTFF